MLKSVGSRTGIGHVIISAAAIEHTELKRRVLEVLGDEDIDSDTRIKLTYIRAARIFGCYRTRRGLY